VIPDVAGVMLWARTRRLKQDVEEAAFKRSAKAQAPPQTRVSSPRTEMRFHSYQSFRKAMDVSEFLVEGDPELLRSAGENRNTGKRHAVFYTAKVLRYDVRLGGQAAGETRRTRLVNYRSRRGFRSGRSKRSS